MNDILMNIQSQSAKVDLLFLEKKQKLNPRMRILFFSRRFPSVRLEEAWENAVQGLGSNWPTHVQSEDSCSVNYY